MAAFFLKAIALLTLAAPCKGVATSMPHIRREQHPARSEQVAMTASGAVLATNAAPENLVKEAILGTIAANIVNKDSHDYCRDDFPLGIDMTNNCTSEHDVRMDQADCEEAATQAGASINSHEDLTFDSFSSHPEGCFKWTCPLSDNGNGICYFYNPDPLVPANITQGQPVCKRKKILPGTVDNSTKASVCREGYAPVKGETFCYEFAGCMDPVTSAGTQFRIDILDASLYNKYPKYCFIDAVDGKVYFNKPPSDTVPDPTDPVGTPVCNVTTVTSYP